MDQAARMLNMRIKIDVWSQGLSNSKREDIREKLGDLFCQLPARRIWLYFKYIRFMLRDGREKGADQAMDSSEPQSCLKGNDAEDIIVDGTFPNLCMILQERSING